MTTPRTALDTGHSSKWALVRGIPGMSSLVSDSVGETTSVLIAASGSEEVLTAGSDSELALSSAWELGLGSGSELGFGSPWELASTAFSVSCVVFSVATGAVGAPDVSLSVAGTLTVST